MRTENCPLDLAAEKSYWGPRQEQFWEVCRQEPTECTLERMGGEEVQMAPTESSEALLEREAE